MRLHNTVPDWGNDVTQTVLVPVPAWCEAPLQSSFHGMGMGMGMGMDMGMRTGMDMVKHTHTRV